MYLQFNSMGLKFEKIKKNLTNRPIPGKPGRARGNRNILKVGPMYDSTCMYLKMSYIHLFLEKGLP